MHVKHSLERNVDKIRNKLYYGITPTPLDFPELTDIEFYYCYKMAIILLRDIIVPNGIGHQIPFSGESEVL